MHLTFTNCYGNLFSRVCMRISDLWCAQEYIHWNTVMEKLLSIVSACRRTILKRYLWKTAYSNWENLVASMHVSSQVRLGNRHRFSCFCLYKLQFFNWIFCSTYYLRKNCSHWTTVFACLKDISGSLHISPFVFRAAGGRRCRTGFKGAVCECVPSAIYRKSLSIRGLICICKCTLKVIRIMQVGKYNRSSWFGLISPIACNFCLFRT